jgi:hypothetical protein
MDRNEIVDIVRKNDHGGTKRNNSQGLKTPIATILARKMEDGKIIVSWSKCHKNDTFSKSLGRTHARIRLANPEIGGKLPQCIQSRLPGFTKRIKKYFKIRSKNDIFVIGLQQKPAHKGKK